jgi:hypothetical protein
VLGDLDRGRHSAMSLKTAKALGIEVPLSMLMRVNEVIE